MSRYVDPSMFFFIKHLISQISIKQTGIQVTNNKDDGVNWSSDGDAGLMEASAELRG